ncbi:telomeric repeat binding factor a [Lates calcarifer]|uniref:Telomeric repeat binding factor a n=1 Tax=Lates calcarifer TaxID=8187 RepID=A0AAJ7LFS9_LATCA|nr:telomeric repeat binding factor a [Lates calcarifer]
MAAKETTNSHQTDVETIVNRWLVDYYLLRAIESFKNNQYADFCSIREVLESVMRRVLPSTDAMSMKIRVLQFLSRINEGERLDVFFDSDESKTPLEAAFVVLEHMKKEFSIPQEDFENVCALVKEMIVVTLIKNNEFDKAKEVLNKHFPKPMVGKKAIFMGLVRQKSRVHEVIEQFNFCRFKEEMLAFCQRLFPVSAPFLMTAAEQLIDKRLAQQDDKAAGLDEQDEPGPSCRPEITTILKHTIIQRARLEAAYKAWPAHSDERTFAQLMEEVEREAQAGKESLSLRLSPTPKKGTNQESEQEALFQRDSGSPMEASPADQPSQTEAVPQTQAGSLSKTPPVLRNRRPYTVAQLVVEPDSQVSSQCTTASQELETEVQTEEPPQSPTITNKDPQSPLTDNEITRPSRKHPRRARKSHSRQLSTDSEEDAPGSVFTGEVCVGNLHNQSINSSTSRKSKKSKQSSSHSEEDPQESAASLRTPVRKTRKQLAHDPLSMDPGDADNVRILDSSLDSSPSVVPQTSSTPHKGSPQGKDPPIPKWKQLYNNAKESKDTWSDEESYFTSRKNSGLDESGYSGHRKRKWTEDETQRLKEGVKKFGEGNWSRIKAYYSFKDRTNVQLKDRWRTMKKLNLL